MFSKFRFLFLLVSMTTLVVGCISSPTLAVPAPRTPTPLPENEETATESFTESYEFLMPCWLLSKTYTQEPGWTRYVNAEYCFSFTYPSDWMITVSKHFVAVSPQAEPTIALTIGVRKDKEMVSTQRTGVGAGDIITVGAVLFLGQEITRDILRYENKDKSVLYNYAIEIFVGDLVFTISLDDFRTDYDTVSLSEGIESQADKIVESFVLVK